MTKEEREANGKRINDAVRKFNRTGEAPYDREAEEEFYRSRPDFGSGKRDGRPVKQ